jgi:hypothetical protein
MKLITTFVAMLMALCVYNSNGQEAESIKEVINKAYVEGIHNNGDLNVTRKGFHPEFQMFVLRNGTLSKVSIDQWIQRIESSRQRNPNAPAEKASAKFLSVDVTKNVASVKLELHRGEKLLFTDYLYLYKIGGDWKIVSKVYNAH